MTTGYDLRPLGEQFQHLFDLISSERFLRMQGLGNEVPFFICPFKPGDAVEMERIQRQLVNKLSQQGIQVLNINLYDLAVEILKENGDWGWYLENEGDMSKQDLKEDLQGILDARDSLIPAIARKMQAETFDVMFLGGVGEVFPYIRSHNVLNNLQSTAKHKPTVMFFPGEYTHSLEQGASLDLFGRLRDDKYYRAFNIFHCEV
ncbi:MAG: DUF1788 domain-containing protein [Desulfuromonas sp.]|uniref:DUF1788 domain-containing protein n=1 Tax=Desulfuromonas sp. TaxID=892 RepID=UPI000CB73F30|nr:DUF1788 domain-containing protein [Desulfuromonas sp.]PLX83271.1 MAG: DUF1788 domain-containing protein [Desulfuromonas sp.]